MSSDVQEAKPEGAVLLIIDPQVDFHPGGSLAVAGADADAERIAAFLRRHEQDIDDVVVTLDSHHRFDISQPGFWVSGEGNPPAPFTAITSEQVKLGLWKPVLEEHQAHCQRYCEALEARGRFTHVVWPEHCLIGTVGQTVEPRINAALQDWALARRRAVHYVAKGANPLTEHFSAFAAEVPLDSDPGTALNAALVARLRRRARVYVCGQALSHCVNRSVRDLVEHWAPRSAADIVLLRDGASPVAGFEGEAAAFVDAARAAGVTVVEHMADV
ncbi:hypothetical protein JKP88DRAFT_265053 [Tribonema minus]|uniref:Nicotinamidase n=1 Tax=Tribonema minus TaxID=303371 RepID=A0A835YMN5_9STRA|nr:hypothetical protein JKP88DRAFT_265053 [Tribonema minus]